MVISKLLKHSVLMLLAAFLMSSCVVSKKKFDELLTERNSLLKQKNTCDSSLAALDKKFRSLSSEADKLRADTNRIGAEYRKTARNLSNLDKDYNKLLANSANEAASLSRDLKRKEEELSKLEANLNKTRLQNEELGNNLKAREKRVEELEKAISDKDKAVRALNDKVNAALLGFKGKDLSVEVKNGRVYVSLSEQLLFKSGRYDVDKKGADALKKLAAILKENTDINVSVDGHTDDVPLMAGTQGMKDNWDLSVLRATSIVRILTEEGVNGAQLSAVGHAEFLPLQPGKTAEVRSKNRRTEIILTPKLDELFKILGN